VPGRAVGLIGRGAFLHHEVGKDAAEDDDGEFFLIELDEEDTPRLLGIERAELADRLDLGGIGRLEPEFVRLVVEGEVFDFMTLQRPFKLIFKVCDEMLEITDGSEVGRHERRTVGW
jgi:hypothetical protein